MRVMAGQPKEKHLYHLPRAVLSDVALEKKIFPWVDDLDVGSLGPTAMAFVNLLKTLRHIILQDVAVLKNSGKEHAIFSQPPLNGKEFDTFAKTLMNEMESLKDPQSTTLEEAVPIISRQLGNLSSELTAATRRETTELKIEIQNVDKKVQNAVQELREEVGQYAGGLKRIVSFFDNVASSFHAGRSSIDVPLVMAAGNILSNLQFYFY